MEENKELEIRNDIKSIYTMLDTIKIDNQDTYVVAVDYTKKIKEKIKEIEEYWEQPIKNAYSVHKELVAKREDNLRSLKLAENILKSHIMSYVVKQEEIKKQKEEELKQLQLEQANEILETAETELEKELALSIMEMDTKLDSLVDKVDGISFKTQYKITIEDDSKVPVIFNGVCIRPIDTSLITKMVQLSKGTLKIDGIKVETTKIPIIKSN